MLIPSSCRTWGQHNTRRGAVSTGRDLLAAPPAAVADAGARDTGDKQDPCADKAESDRQGGEGGERVPRSRTHADFAFWEQRKVVKLNVVRSQSLFRSG